MSDYKPGSFFLTKIPGLSGWAINLGQALAGDGSRWSHAGIILDETGTVVEAEPGGARLANLSEYAGRPMLVSDAPVQQWLVAAQGQGNAYADTLIRTRVVAEARKLGPHDGQPGVGYSALDYLALALIHLENLLTGRPRPTWRLTKFIRNRVKDSGHAICSQLVDLVMANAGIKLFDDGRWSGDVMPADLAGYAEDWSAKQ